MKSSFTSALTVAALLLMSVFSCVREDSMETVKVEFHAAFEVEYVSEIPQVWSSSDHIAVSGGDGPFKTSRSSDGEPEAIFQGQTVAAYEYFAAMPYDAVEHFSPSSPSIVSMQLPCLQTAVSGGISHQARIAVAHTSSADQHLIFRNPLAYLKFTVGPQSGTIRSVSVISTDGTRLSGSFSVDCSSSDPYPYPSPASQSNVALVAEKDCLSEGEYHIAMFPSEEGSYEIAFEDTDGRIALVQISPGHVERGEVIDLGLIHGLQFKEWDIKPVGATILFFRADAAEQYIRYRTDCQVEASVTMGADWLSIVRTKAVERGTLQIEVKPNTGSQRMGQILVESIDGNSRITYNIFQFSDGATLVDKQRQALVDLYRSAGGEQWKRSDNWCTDAPMDEWYGVTTDEKGSVTEVYLPSNGLQGTLPDNIGDLAGSAYTSLDLRSNQLEGDLPGSVMKIYRVNLSGNRFSRLLEPDDLFTCPIYSLTLSGNAFDGPLPQWLAELPFLYQLDLSGNHFTGALPDSYADILGSVYLHDNWLTGTLPPAFLDNDNFVYFWPLILRQYGEGFDMNGVKIPMTDFLLNDQADTPDEIYSSNVYTAIVTLSSGAGDSDLLRRIALWYDSFHDSGFEVICIGTAALPEAYSSYPWYITSYMPSYWSYVRQFAQTTVTLVDSEGNIVTYPFTGYGAAQAMLVDAFGPFEEPPVLPPPSSEKVNVIQEASVGAGIDLVFLGDAFTSEMIEDGLFDKAVEDAVKAFFSIAPVSDFKDYFNIYSVSLPSVSGEYSENSDTAFDCWWGDGASVGGNDDLCRHYTLKAISSDRIDDALTIVLMNSERYAGTTYMYSPSSGQGSSGWAVSYIPLCARRNDFRFLVRHEAVGHGFAKLADEYAYQENGTIPQETVSKIQSKERYGWWQNIDFTDVPADLKWAQFIADKRYAGEQVGAYEGGYGYWNGIWVPTAESLMRGDHDFFNPPSRMAVWNRIGSLAYGSIWDPSYEDFVSYDLDSSRQTTRSADIEYELPASPVIR